MKERAVYYCRVSTEEENQLSSMLHQREEAQQVIREHGWELVDEYIDEGRSGTTTRHRLEYNRMNQDMEADRFDILVVKAQDRLMRDTREWYLFLDRLLRNRKKLYFYLEQRFYSPEDALLTGIKAILAEDYSRSLSRNINHAHERRQRSGSNVVLTSRTWGYDKKERQVVINEPEAEMIRLIFELAAQDYGSRIIAGRLTAQGYRNRNGGLIAEQTVRRIIRNPLYKGTARMHTKHWNFETRQVEHIAKKDWIYHEGAVPAIVSEELWTEANQRMDERRLLVREAEEPVFRGRKCNRYPLSGKIRCGLCGSIYWRRTRRRTSDWQHLWSCSRFLAEGRKSCQNLHLPEDKLEQLLLQIAESSGISEILVYPSYLEVILKEKPFSDMKKQQIRVEIRPGKGKSREYRVCL